MGASGKSHTIPASAIKSRNNNNLSKSTDTLLHYLHSTINSDGKITPKSTTGRSMSVDKRGVRGGSFGGGLGPTITPREVAVPWVSYRGEENSCHIGGLQPNSL